VKSNLRLEDLSSPAASEPPKSGTLLTMSFRKSKTLKLWTHCFLKTS